MEELLFPWESHVMKNHPLAMPIFFIILGIILSIITWIRQKNQ